MNYDDLVSTEKITACREVFSLFDKHNKGQVSLNYFPLMVS